MSGPLPRPFGKYILVRSMESGGVGELFLAVAGEVGGFEKLCVVRTLDRGLQNVSDDALASFVSQAKIAVKLSHSNLVQMVDAGVVGGVRYLAVEHVEGLNLRQLLDVCYQRRTPLPPAAALYIALSACRGLHYAHNYGDHSLVHGELCPSKLLVSFFGEVKIADFGVHYAMLAAPSTPPGRRFGQLNYLAPEQATEEAVEARTDVYAIGMMLWEMLVGEPMRTPAADVSSARASAMHTSVMPPSSRNGKLPPQIDPLVVKALQPRLDHRHRSAEALRNAIATALSQVDPTFDASNLSELMRKLFRKQMETAKREREQLLSQSYDHLRRTTTGPPPGSMPSFEANLSGELIGERYKAIRQIGEGGMGAVYEAEHLEIGRRVAIKVLHAAYSRDPEAVARFREEARAATKIGHPNIVEVTDSGTTHGGRFFFVMEMLSGVDLAQVMAKTRIIDKKRALDITLQICAALHAAHEAGIIHRDLKPENIFLTKRAGRKDFVKILDFGIAKNVELAKEGEARLTTPGIAMGTPEYMAPEQAAGLDVDRRIDVYATGAMLYEMLTGHLPHEAQNLMQLLSKKASEPPTPPSKHRKNIPRSLEVAILRSLESDRERRFQTMEQLATALELMESGLLKPADDGDRESIGTDPTLELEAMVGYVPSPAPAYVVGGDDVRLSNDVFTLEQQRVPMPGDVASDPTMPLKALQPEKRINWPAWLLGSMLVGLVAGGLIWWRAASNGSTDVKPDAAVVDAQTTPPDATPKPDVRKKPKKKKHRKMTPQEVDRMLEWAKRAAAGKRWFRPRSDNVRFLLKRIERDYPGHPKVKAFLEGLGKDFNRQARRSLRRRRYAAAERVYKRWSRLDPEAQTPRWGLHNQNMRDAQKQLRRRRYKSATRFALAAARWQERSYLPWMFLGEMARKRRHYKAAVGYYKKALEKPKLSKRTIRRLKYRLRISLKHAK
ncbi:MAG: serine/threonine protein kinase [Myxococcales bacterium]|nr:serine/threonine protein kinase [Myxococcales bacterium]